MKMPLLVDTIDDRVGHAYSGMPDRLYVIDREGRVAYQGGRGPFGFKPGEMEQALVMLLLDEGRGQEILPERGGARVPLPNDADAWRLLPAASACGFVCSEIRMYFDSNLSNALDRIAERAADARRAYTPGALRQHDDVATPAAVSHRAGLPPHHGNRAARRTLSQQERQRETCYHTQQ